MRQILVLASAVSRNRIAPDVLRRKPT